MALISNETAPIFFPISNEVAFMFQTSKVNLSQSTHAGNSYISSRHIGWLVPLIAGVLPISLPFNFITTKGLIYLKCENFDILRSQFSISKQICTFVEAILFNAFLSVSAIVSLSSSVSSLLKRTLLEFDEFSSGVSLDVISSFSNGTTALAYSKVPVKPLGVATNEGVGLTATFASSPSRNDAPTENAFMQARKPISTSTVGDVAEKWTPFLPPSLLELELLELELSLSPDSSFSRNFICAANCSRPVTVLPLVSVAEDLKNFEEFFRKCFKSCGFCFKLRALSSFSSFSPLSLVLTYELMDIRLLSTKLSLFEVGCLMF
mmetsp:Transcript_7297/g.10423  ORF Transcript_7297/g.10423 Transcript_7297/m.10423 type:complete len:321 (+) Transcript_7297:413-1375(+)